MDIYPKTEGRKNHNENVVLNRKWSICKFILTINISTLTKE